jgi:hypothetical protein
MGPKRTPKPPFDLKSSNSGKGCLAEQAAEPVTTANGPAVRAHRYYRRPSTGHLNDQFLTGNRGRTVATSYKSFVDDTPAMKAHRNLFL